MKGRERPCSIRRRLRDSPNVLQRSVESAAITDICVFSAFIYFVPTGGRLSIKLPDGGNIKQRPPLAMSGLTIPALIANIAASKKGEDPVKARSATKANNRV